MAAQWQGPRKYFFHIKQAVAAKWYDLAYWLGFDDSDTGNIAGRNRDDRSCCMDLLQEWLSRNGEAATTEVLMGALSNAGLKDVLKGLKDKYPELATLQVTQSPNAVQPSSGQPQRASQVQPQSGSRGQPQPATAGPSNNTEVELTPYFNIIAKNMGVQWPQLASNLGLPFTQIQAIKQENSNNCWMCCQQILHTWFYSNGAQATLDALKEAVRESDHQDVTEMLEMKQLELQKNTSGSTSHS
ncbi:uncharacterized protein LOC118404002 [Branchiostoma floridae]|uniref:Uncharacterized protein LOC118404002 n=1 Tax=Branchiostoma floridae TaxID=7739 RepID=A0A9J7HFN9_BRAFL|nr:uncharacterized protein LOC118404002 [Branchiostoma floridae]